MLSSRRGGRDPTPAHIAFAYAFSHAQLIDAHGAKRAKGSKTARGAKTQPRSAGKFAIPVRHTAIKASERKEQTGVARSGHLAPAGALSIRRSRS